MNYKMIRYILSMILSAEAGFMLLPILICILYGEYNIIPSFLYTILVIIVSVVLLGFRKPKDDKVFSREGFISVSLGWLFISLFGALPFYFSGSIPSIVDCIFETVSGFTTTGATILTEVENLSHGILFWREFTHWIGGMGVIVFLLMLTQISEGHSLYIMRAEVPGPSVGKIAPKARSNSLILYGIYTALTIVEAIFLLCGGMPAFDAVTTAMGTAGTGGFSVRNLGIAAYNSAYVEWVVSIFMLIFGVNFNLYYLLLFKHFKEAFSSEEFKIYIFLVSISSVIIGLNVMSYYNGFGESLRKAFFQVTAIITTTGFYGVNYMDWPGLSKAILFLLLFTGACAGSTAGGLKLSRIIIGLKLIKKSVRQLSHPHDVSMVKFEAKIVDKETRGYITVYMATFFIILVLSSLAIMATGFDMETSLSAALSSFNNVGPGFGLVGHFGDYNIFNDAVKLLLSALMLIGRLEIFPVLILLAPSTWRKN